jgi:PTH1 family peptidyl-tRNA hydrolase
MSCQIFGWIKRLLSTPRKETPEQKLNEEVSTMKYLIVGLGNIGAEYLNTRHNIGFKVVEALAEKQGVSFSTDRYGAVAEFRHRGHVVTLLKPSTYMNLSGKAVRYWLEATKTPIENLLVIVDDIAIPFGSLRMRTKGSDGGHNGLKNINELLNTDSYSRIRFGIGGDFPRGFQVDHVLGEWSSEEQQAMPERLKFFAEAALSFVSIGAQRTMNTYNKK